MECNKDEAVRSKDIAEGKFLQQDVAGARKFALKAQHLFPELEGLHQLIAVLDVHVVAQEKVNGHETNWYGILQVDPLADEATIRKQYRKLALLLHPDKNKAVGAEAAFKLISEAWGILSDKSKKAAHDLRRNMSVSRDPKVSQGKGAQAASNGYCSFTRSATTSRTQPQSYPQPQTQLPKAHTFWTSCSSCKMQFEYLRAYENQNLCCLTCRKPFLAKEVHVVSGNAWGTSQDQQSFRTKSAGVAHANGVRENSFSNGKFSWGVYNNGVGDQAAAAAATANIVHQTYEKVKQARVEAQKEARRKEQKEKDQKLREKELERKAKAAANAKAAFDRLMARSKAKLEQVSSPEQAAASENKATSEAERNTVKKGSENPDSTTQVNNHRKHEQGSNIESGEEPEVTEVSFEEASKTTPRRSSRCKRNASNTVASDHEIQDDFSPSKKARLVRQTSLDMKDLKEHAGGRESAITENLKCGVGLQQASVQTRHESKIDIAAAETELSAKNVEGYIKQVDQRELDEMKASILPGFQNKFSGSPAMTLEIDDDVDMDVPDPDFYDFDKDRTENHVDVGQIWAVYDDDDGMPRYYLRINKIYSREPLKVHISWLESRSPSTETIAWLESGFSYTCGEFKVGKHTVRNGLNTFSHLVAHEKVQKGVFWIYPQMGDVWALYKGWNVSMRAVGQKREYEMVEVLTDYQGESGVSVVLLAKVHGFKTVFKKQVQAVQWISSQELLKFSHRIPAHQLTPEEVSGLPEGCWELDPASTPLELITGRTKD